MLKALLASSILFAFLLGTAAANANEENPFGYGLSRNNFLFTSVDQAIQGEYFRLAIRNGESAEIFVELVDIFADSSGAKRAIPLGSSPYTPEGLVVFQTELDSYIPNGELQYFDIPFSFVNTEGINRPIFGGLKISIATSQANNLGADDEPISELEIQSAIVGTFAYVPLGMLNLLDYQPALQLTDVNLVRTNPDFLIPDLPGLYNQGPLEISYQLKNTGNIFLEARTTIEARQVSLFDFGSQATVEDESQTLAFSTQTTSQLLVPGQSITSNQVLVDGSRSTTDAQLIQGQDALGWGIFEISIRSEGSLGDELLAAAQTQSMTIIIFPWKQGVVLLVLLVLLRRVIGRAINWVLDYLRAVKDFRNNRTRNPILTPRSASAGLKLLNSAGPSRLAAGSNSSSFGSSNLASPSGPISASTSNSPKTSSNPNASSNSSNPTKPDNKPLYPFWYEPPKKSGDR